MKIYGLTGGIACGKSTVAEILTELGAAVVDADEASSYDLSVLVWWFVTYGEFLSGLGLLFGGVLTASWLYNEKFDWMDIIDPQIAFISR